MSNLLGVDLRVRRATSNDLGTVLDILIEAGNWLLSRGIRQWPEPPAAELMVQAIAREEVYLAELGEVVVGTFGLRATDELWRGRPGEALYLHRLAVRRAYAGAGLGVQLLRSAERLAALAGKDMLRLDCWAGNSALRAYYARAGFTACSTVPEHDYMCALFEKRLGLVHG